MHSNEVQYSFENTTYIDRSLITFSEFFLKIMQIPFKNLHVLKNLFMLMR